jgi:hypothetical protein
MDARQAVTFAHRLALVSVLTALFAGALGAAAPAAAQPARQGYVVVLRDSVRSAAATAGRLERAHGFRSEHVYGHALKGFAARLGDPDNPVADRYFGPLVSAAAY